MNYETKGRTKKKVFLYLYINAFLCMIQLNERDYVEGGDLVGFSEPQLIMQKLSVQSFHDENAQITISINYAK